MSDDLERFRVIDAEPCEPSLDRGWRSGFAIGVLIGLLAGIWIGFLARLAWLIAS